MNDSIVNVSVREWSKEGLSETMHIALQRDNILYIDFKHF